MSFERLMCVQFTPCVYGVWSKIFDTSMGIILSLLILLVVPTFRQLSFSCLKSYHEAQSVSQSADKPSVGQLFKTSFLGQLFHCRSVSTAKSIPISKSAFAFIYILIVYILSVNKVIYKQSHLKLNQQMAQVFQKT